VPGELALVEERLLARDRRDRDRGEAGVGDPFQRPAHQLGLEQSEAALETISPRPRDLRDPRQVAPVVLLDQRDMVERVEIELGRLADGADYGVEALVGADRRALVGNTRQPQNHRLELGFALREIALQRRGAGAGFLRLPSKLGLFLRARVLELGADCVALGPQPLDLGFGRAHRRIERQQRVEVELDAFVADRALDRGAIGLDKIEAQHAKLPNEGRSSRKLGRDARRIESQPVMDSGQSRTPMLIVVPFE